MQSQYSGGQIQQPVFQPKSPGDPGAAEGGESLNLQGAGSVLTWLPHPLLLENKSHVRGRRKQREAQVLPLWFETSDQKIREPEVLERVHAHRF